MQKSASVLFSLIVIILGFSIILNEANVLSRISTVNVGWLVNTLGYILYAVAAILAWRRYTADNTIFYKWLSVSLTLKVGLWLESILYRHFGPSLQLAMEQPYIYKIISLFNYTLQQGGNLAVILLLIYAVGNYGAEIRFFNLLRPRWAAIIGLTFVTGVVTNFYLSGVAQQFKLMHIAGYLALDTLMAVIGMYGLLITQQKLKVYHNLLLKWLALFFALGVAVWLVNITLSIIYFISPTPNHIYSLVQIYLIQAFSIAMPALLVFIMAFPKRREQ